MTDMVAVGIACIALVVSIVSALSEARARRRADEREEERRRDEIADLRRSLQSSREARVSLQVTRPSEAANYFVMLRNDGAATARRVAVRVDELPAEVSPLVLTGKADYGPIAPGVAVPVELLNAHDTPDEVLMHVTWMNGDGSVGQIESRIGLF